MGKKVFYGFGGLSYSVISQTVSNFFMFFATSVMGLKGVLVGVAVAISTIWDGISDTIVGFLSDNKPMGKMGKRNGYMLIATIGMSIFNIVLWVIPSTLSSGLKFVWILISLFLLETFNTMFATPYSALGNDMATSYDDRTKINAYNTVFYLIGIIIPSVLLVIFLPNTDEYPIGQLNPAGYIKIAITTSTICLLFGLMSSILTIPKEKNENNKSKTKFSLKELYKSFLKSFSSKKLNKLILGYVFTSIATVFLCSVGLHFFTYSFFYTSNQIMGLLLTLLLGTIISQPVWVLISKKKKKKPALILGILVTIFSVFGIISLYIFRIELYKISYFLMLCLILLCGVGSGSIYTLPVSLYGDAIDSMSVSKNKMATYGGMLTFAGNIANSITQFLVGILLDVIKFDSAKEVQSLGVQTGLALIVFVGIEASLILGCLTFASYKEKSEKIN